MTVLVTGGAGFLGRHLVTRLREEGEEVFVAEHGAYDLTEQRAVRRLLRDAAAQLVFHLAAEVGGIGANQRHPGRYWYANLAMGTNVLEECRVAGVDKLVIVGTVCSYPRHTPVPFSETELWNGYPEETNAPYGIAKKALLVGAQAYRHEYGLRSIFLLPANLYGPGDNFDPDTSHVVPALIRRLTEAGEVGQPEVVLWGDGSPTREFLYVEDCAEALVLAAERYDAPEPVNVGTGVEVSIRELAELVARLTGYCGDIKWDTTRPNGQPRRCLDVSRAAEAFGFGAGTSLEEGLERTVAWYRAHHRDAVGTAGSC